MSAVLAKVAAQLGLDGLLGLTLEPKECRELSQQLTGAAEGLRRQQQGLHSVYVSVHDHLLGIRPDHGIDFPFLDALQARADALVAADPDCGYTHNGARFSLASARDELAGAIQDAEPFRKVPRP